MGQYTRLLAIVGLLLLAGPAQAGYTPFNAPPAGERSHAEILSEVYGGSFVADGLNFANELGVAALRVNDSGCDGGDPSKGCPSTLDRVWEIGPAIVTAKATDAELLQSFGWNEGLGDSGLGTLYTELVNEVLVGPVHIHPTGRFLWGIHPSSDDIFWSKSALNSDGADHMITYLITGLPFSGSVWLTFWEDLPNSDWDADYNDFVVEIRTASAPEPGASWLLALGLAAIYTLRRR
jgi:hypothetical protein